MVPHGVVQRLTVFVSRSGRSSSAAAAMAVACGCAVRPLVAML